VIWRAQKHARVGFVVQERHDDDEGAHRFMLHCRPPRTSEIVSDSSPGLQRTYAFFLLSWASATAAATAAAAE
jgi:hypothetical protein